MYQFELCSKYDREHDLGYPVFSEWKIHQNITQVTEVAQEKSIIREQQCSLAVSYRTPQERRNFAFSKHIIQNNV